MTITYASDILEPINFRIHAGVTPTISVPVLDSLGGVVGITSATIVWVVTESNQDKRSLLTKRNTGGGILLDNPDHNGFTIVLTRADTEELSGDLYHESRVVIAGMEDIVIYGTLSIVPTVTAGVT